MRESESTTRNANVFSVSHSERYCKTAHSTATRATAALFDCGLVDMVAIQKLTPFHMEDSASLREVHLLWNLNNSPSATPVRNVIDNVANLMSQRSARWSEPSFEARAKPIAIRQFELVSELTYGGQLDRLANR